jgi:peptide/nickel transport system substrate-binding protein
MNADRARATIAGLLLGMTIATAALAQKQGGILRVQHRDSPASMSILEEGTISAIMPMMGVFNNLVLFDQHVPQNRVEAIVPDLATSWSWSEDGTELTFKLRHGVKWHDGKPFTAADIKCTYDLLMGRTKQKLRLNFREAWFFNLGEVTTNGDTEVTFHLKRPQPAFFRCSRLVIRRSIPATSRRATCAAIRSAPARSNLSNTSRTSRSR